MLNIYYGDMADAVYNTVAYFKFDGFWRGPFDIRILNTKQIVHFMSELVLIAGEFV